MTAPLPGVIIASPASGCGKTTLVLSLLRVLCRRADAPLSLKIGTDYLETQFHRLASGRQSFNVDTWSMKPNQILELIDTQASLGSWAVAEGEGGLFDGAQGMGRAGYGATSDFAALTGWPVVLVLDASGQGQSVAAVVRGMRDHRPHVSIAAVILNNVGSHTHVETLRSALEEVDLPVLGAVPKGAVPDLGRQETGLDPTADLRRTARNLDAAADTIQKQIDIMSFRKIAGAWATSIGHGFPVMVPPLGQRISVAHDPGSVFFYDHILEGWQAAGARVDRFSPLEDEGPVSDCDAIYLPGGYPEFYLGRLASAGYFKAALRRAAESGIPVYGEGGGYMLLGRGIVDQRGERHSMLGLLDHEVSFSTPRLQQGRRFIDLITSSVLGRSGTRLFGHENHYGSLVKAGQDQPLAKATDSAGRDIGLVGGHRGSVMGSFFRLIAT